MSATASGARGIDDGATYPTPAVSSGSRLVGCGRISQNHFDALRKVDGLTLTAVCDIDARARAEPPREQEGVAVVHVVSTRCCSAPSATSSRSARRRGCTRRRVRSRRGPGKHVITEKPMAISLGQADELVKACDDAGVFLFVVKQNRLNPPIQLLQARGRQGPIRPHLSWRISPCAGSARRSTTTRRRGAARGNSTAARS